jgi:IS605 OrfB family transposase
VERLVSTDLSDWSRSWSDRWKRDDAAWTGRLKDLKRWIAPRGLRPLSTDDPATLEQKKTARAAARYVGGLSISRINTISGLYQILKAFKMRPEPDDPRKNVPQKGDDELENFNRRLLDMRDRLREQRVKQLASRIVEAALGIGRVKIPGGGKTPKRPRRAVDVPCHAVVIESLTHYRPDDLRTRRENRQLMQWSSAKVQNYLKEACQLYGLHLREVQAGYTSRQDSRTGAPGIRCQDVPVRDFMKSPFWKKQVAQAEKKKADGDAREQMLRGLNARWKDKAEADWKAARPLRIPLQGGEVFVSADSRSPAAKGLQADLNAAANIGLKALLDPDFTGKWWYVPCDPRTFKPIEERTKGCLAIDADKPLKNPPAPERAKGKTKRGNKARTGEREVVNLWRDACTRPLSEGPWCVYQEYKNHVQSRVVNQILCPWNDLKSP